MILYKAVELLYQLAIASANKGLFQKSEAYRDRLYEVDSMALSRIVAVNEVIEKQKSRLMPPDYHKLWASFFEKLSQEEANAFFFSLKKAKVDSHPLEEYSIHLQLNRPFSDDAMKTIASLAT